MKVLSLALLLGCSCAVSGVCNDGVCLLSNGFDISESEIEWILQETEIEISRHAPGPLLRAVINSKSLAIEYVSVPNELSCNDGRTGEYFPDERRVVVAYQQDSVLGITENCWKRLLVTVHEILHYYVAEGMGILLQPGDHNVPGIFFEAPASMTGSSVEEAMWFKVMDKCDP